SSAHPCSKISADLTKDYGNTTGHIFATVIAYSFYNGFGPRVSNTEPFARFSVYIGFARGGSVKGYIAGDYIFLGFKGRFVRHFDYQFSTRKSFAQIIVGVPIDHHGKSFGGEGPKTLPCGPRKIKF